MARVGFVGLGVMGAPMAGHLLAAGNDLTVWNRTPGKDRALREKGGKVAGSLEELGSESEIVFLCVNRSEDVAECLAPLIQDARPGTLFVDHSTIAPSAAKQFHANLAAKGLAFVDAPVTGGSMGAQRGQLTVFCGGAVEDVTRALPYIAAYAKRAERVGGPGMGQLMKLANQIAVGASVLGLCECLSFAEKAGLDVSQAKDMIGGGAGGSWAFENYGPKLLAKDWTPGFSVKNQRKDFGYCREAAGQIGAAIPGTDLVDGLLSRLEEFGHGDWTTVALYEVYRELKAGS